MFPFPHRAFRHKAEHCVSCLCLLASLFLLALPVLCAAQHKPLLAADLDSRLIKVGVKTATLDTMVALLSKQLNVSIFVDDRPIHPPIDFSMETTARKALNRIADAYDYDWKLTKSGSILLYKRFRNPQEFPQSDYAEWLQVSKDALRVLGETEHDFSFTSGHDILHSFVSSLSYEQGNELRNGKRLPATALDAKSTAYLREYMYVRAFEVTVLEWRGLRDILLQMPQNALKLQSELDIRDTFISQKEQREQNHLQMLVLVYKDKAGVTQTYPLDTVTSVKGPVSDTTTVHDVHIGDKP